MTLSGSQRQFECRAARSAAVGRRPGRVNQVTTEVKAATYACDGLIGSSGDFDLCATGGHGC